MRDDFENSDDKEMTKDERRHAVFNVVLFIFIVFAILFLTSHCQAEQVIKYNDDASSEDVKSNYYQLVLYRERGSWYSLARFSTLDDCEWARDHVENIEYVKSRFGIRFPLMVCVKR